MKNLKIIFAFILLAIGIEELVRWFIITDQDISFEAMKTAYHLPLPSFLQNDLHTVLLFVCFSLSAFLFLQNKDRKGLAYIAKGGFALSALLAFWQVFSLM